MEKLILTMIIFLMVIVTANADEPQWFNHYGVASQAGFQSSDGHVITGEATWRPEERVIDNIYLRGQLGASIGKTSSDDHFAVLDLAVAPSYRLGSYDFGVILGYQFWLAHADGGFEVGPELSYKLDPKFWLIERIFANYERVFSNQAVNQIQIGIGLSF